MHVEGTARHSAREGSRFFNISSASLAEVGYGLHAAHRLGYIDADLLRELGTKARVVSAPLHGLLRRYRMGRALGGMVTATLAMAFIARVLL